MASVAEVRSRVAEAVGTPRGVQPARASILVGLIGAGIQSSLTPALHEREADEQGLRYLYRLIDLDRLGLGPGDLSGLMESAEQMGFAGLNITHPCKQAVLRLLHEMSPEAAAIGAVNTVVFQGGRRIGHNTDCWGFAESFRSDMAGVRTTRVLQVGAGGGGAAVANALLELGVSRLAIFDTEAGRAVQLAARLTARFGKGRAEAVSELRAAAATADGLVNTTPVGMDKYPGTPVPAELLRADLWVADIIYFPAETELLRWARAIGTKVMPGGGMAVFQAVEAFRLFTGVVPDTARMRRHFLSLVEGRA